MKRLLRTLLLVFVCVGLASFVPTAAKASPPLLRLEVASKVVDVDTPFTVDIIAMADSSSAMPSDPRLKVPRSFKLSRPQISSQTRMEFGTGRGTVRQSGIRASFTVVATRTGEFWVGPASVRLDGRRKKLGRVKIKVVPKGTAPRSRRRRRFDPFGNLFPNFPGFGGFRDDPPRDPEPDPAANAKLGMSRAPSPGYFVRGLVSKRRVVLGEPVVVSFYAYHHGHAHVNAGKERPNYRDFEQYDAISGPVQLRRVRVGDEVWYTQLVERKVLFPLRTGELDLGKLELKFYPRRGFGLGRNGAVRLSNPLKVRVRKPPKAGKPPTYVEGTVGRFSLAAQAEPRLVNLGDQISVTAQVTGKLGRFPRQLTVPHQKGLEWSKPTVKSKREVTSDGLGTSGNLTYLVKVTDPKLVHVGHLKLEYYDPVAGGYRSADVDLGAIKVIAPTAPVTSGNAPSASGPPVKTDPFAALSFRKILGTGDARSKPLSDKPWYWLLLALGPLAVAFGEGGIRLAKSTCAAWSSTESKGKRAIRDTLSEARSQLQSGKGEKAVNLSRKALSLALEVAYELKVSGLLQQELVGGLEEAGVAAALARQVAEALKVGEGWPYEPHEAGDAKAYVASAEEFVEAVLKGAKA